MKDLVEKAEAMMNVILLVSVVLAWACFASWHDPIAIGRRLYSAVSRVHGDQRSESMRKFLDEVDAQAGHEKREQVSQANVETALAIGGDPGSAKPGDSSAARNAVALASELEVIRARTGITNAVTFEGLSQGVNPQITLPFIDEELGSKFAVLVLAVGLLGPFAYLLSLMSAMKEAIKDDNSSEGRTWLFFHPGKLGPVLGSAWLLAPSLAIVASVCFVPIEHHQRIGCAVGLAVIAAVPIVRAWQLRASFRSRVNETKKT